MLEDRLTPGQWNRIFRDARKNALSRGVPFSLSVDEFLMLRSRAGGRCEVSSIPFSMENPHGGGRRPWAPSLDRVRSREGYTLNNCRLVCVAANYAMNVWGEDVLHRLSASVVSWKKNKVARFAFPEEKYIAENAALRSVISQLEAEKAALAAEVYLSSDSVCLMFCGFQQILSWLMAADSPLGIDRLSFSSPHVAELSARFFSGDILVSKTSAARLCGLSVSRVSQLMKRKKVGPPSLSMSEDEKLAFALRVARGTLDGGRSLGFSPLLLLGALSFLRADRFRVLLSCCPSLAC